jgi:hypothetical protein
MTKEELETKLVGDDQYMTTRVMNGTKTLFVEFLGFLILEVWGSRIHAVAVDLMSPGAFGELFHNHKFDPARAAVQTRSFNRDEALLCVYELYKHCVYRLVTDPAWKRQYDAAIVKSRFLYEDKNRRRLIGELLTVDQLIGRRAGGIGEPWSDIFDEAKGVFAFFRDWIPDKSVRRAS